MSPFTEWDQENKLVLLNTVQEMPGSWSYLSMKRRSGFLSSRLGYSCWVVSMASPILPDNTSFWISASRQETRPLFIQQARQHHADQSSGGQEGVFGMKGCTLRCERSQGVTLSITGRACRSV